MSDGPALGKSAAFILADRSRIEVGSGYLEVHWLEAGLLDIEKEAAPSTSVQGERVRREQRLLLGLAAVLNAGAGENPSREAIEGAGEVLGLLLRQTLKLSEALHAAAGAANPSEVNEQ